MATSRARWKPCALLLLGVTSCYWTAEYEDLTSGGGGAGGACAGRAVSEVSGNRTNNPSFEHDLNGWDGFQSVRTRVRIPTAPDGCYAARVEFKPGGNTSYTINDEPATVSQAKQGTQYTTRAYVAAASPNVTNKAAYVLLREFDTMGNMVTETSSPQIALKDAFQEVSTTAMATVAGNRLNIVVAQDYAASGDAFYVDAVTLVAMP